MSKARLVPITVTVMVTPYAIRSCEGSFSIYWYAAVENVRGKSAYPYRLISASDEKEADIIKTNGARNRRLTTSKQAWITACDKPTRRTVRTTVSQRVSGPGCDAAEMRIGYLLCSEEHEDADRHKQPPVVATTTV